MMYILCVIWSIRESADVSSVCPCQTTQRKMEWENKPVKRQINKGISLKSMLRETHSNWEIYTCVWGFPSLTYFLTLCRSRRWSRKHIRACANMNIRAEPVGKTNHKWVLHNRWDEIKERAKEEFESNFLCSCESKQFYTSSISLVIAWVISHVLSNLLKNTLHQFCKPLLNL